MANEANVTSPSQDIRRERFEFVLKINDFIVCQRFFKINRLRNNALSSLELTDSLNYCVQLIQNDLRSKSNLYNWYTAPQIFENRDEFDSWIRNNKLDIPYFVILRDSKEVFVWNGEDLTLYEKRFNVGDYVSNEGDVEETQNTLKFEFLDDGKLLYSRIWDANVYPRFIRNNIDLSNSKNKYDAEMKPFESFLVKLLIKDKSDLVSQIINEICDVCSLEGNRYTTKMKYGNTLYKTINVEKN